MSNKKLGPISKALYWEPGKPMDPRPYTVTLSGSHALVILNPDSENPLWKLFKLPVKHVLHLNRKLLKILFDHNLISKHQVQLAFDQWSQEESELIFIKTDHRGLKRETITMPIRRRGNEHYHKHTYSRIRWYEMVYNAFPTLYEKTNQYKTVQAKTNKKRFYRKRVHHTNQLLITLTYPYWEGIRLGIAWARTSPDFNRWMTNLKGRLKRRGIKPLFYFKALEATKKGMPHFHILIKLSKPIEVKEHYNGWQKRYCYKPFDKSLFAWKYGHYTVDGITNNKAIPYITKYITKTTNNKNPYGVRNKTLALSWVSNKRLYSTSMVCMFKHKFPALAAFMQLTEKFTINKMVDKCWNGLKYPKIPWTWYKKSDLIRRFRYTTRKRADLASDEILYYPLASRLNYEGFYQVTALRCHRNNTSVTIPIPDVIAHPSVRRDATKKVKNFREIRKIKQEFKIN
jgi:hypothetical protein